MQAKGELVPSVSLDELRHYEHVRNTFEGTASEVDAKASNGLPPVASNGHDHAGVHLARKMVGQLGKKSESAKGRGGSTLDESREGHHAEGIVGSESEDEYVIRTDRLTLNGGSVKAPAVPASPGKGKGRAAKSALVEDGFAARENGDGGAGEDLYD